MNTNKLIETVVKAADDKKALDIVVMDMKGISGVSDAFIVMEAMNTRQIGAIVDNIVDKAEEAGMRAHHIEGNPNSGWVLIDFLDVVVSVFSHDERSFYNLEKLWSDAPLVDISGMIGLD
ncbi:ribosome silencing factor [Streptococcaceae bacterium ESL0687]|nr:ribosome silencing factor [Streptococcaceae bacterium ESL0687]